MHNIVEATGTLSLLSPYKFHTFSNKDSIQCKDVCKRGSGVEFFITLRIPEIFCFVVDRP